MQDSIPDGMAEKMPDRMPESSNVRKESQMKCQSRMSEHMYHIFLQVTRQKLWQSNMSSLSIEVKLMSASCYKFVVSISIEMHEFFP